MTKRTIKEISPQERERRSKCLGDQQTRVDNRKKLSDDVGKEKLDKFAKDYDLSIEQLDLLGSLNIKYLITLFATAEIKSQLIRLAVENQERGCF